MNIKKIIINNVVELLRQASCELPNDVVKALRDGLKNEKKGSIAEAQLAAIIDNFEQAEKFCLPMCQDTGIHIYYVEFGEDVNWLRGTELKKALCEASKKATIDVPMRPNAVNPFTNMNSNDNNGRNIPFINWEIVKGDKIKITAFPKGGGSENMSSLGMLKPGEGLIGVKKFVVDTVITAGGQPCPPIIIGIGIGGGADIALKLAKKQLQRTIGERHPEKVIANLEIELVKAINMIGIGPQGLGGITTCIDVFVEYAYRHPASLPVGISIQCWAGRHASAVFDSNGNVKFLRK
ncbi:MAG: fumarate hydratase [Spirochaetes bacterium]|nr:fumarate hydratase [Spirochaetota bacterium]